MSEAKEHLTTLLRKHFSTPDAEELTAAIVHLVKGGSDDVSRVISRLSRVEQIAADDKAAIEAHQAKLKAEAAAAAEAHQAELDAADAERARINEQSEQAELAADVADPGDEDGDERDEHEHEAQDAALHHKPKKKKRK